MPVTPDITLKVNLDDLTGSQIGSTSDVAKVRIALCGFGPALPRIPGTTMIGDAGPFDTLYTGAQVDITLWANDQITPSGTFYSIELLDGNDDVVQCGAYQFTGGPQTIDLSTVAPILPPYGFPLGGLAVKSAIAPVYPGTVYNAPGRIIMVIYNTTILDPATDYTLSVNNTRATLNFTTEASDNVTFLCVL